MVKCLIFKHQNWLKHFAMTKNSVWLHPFLGAFEHFWRALSWQSVMVPRAVMAQQDEVGKMSWHLTLCLPVKILPDKKLDANSCINSKEMTLFCLGVFSPAHISVFLSVSRRGSVSKPLSMGCQWMPRLQITEGTKAGNFDTGFGEILRSPPTVGRKMQLSTWFTQTWHHRSQP